MTFGNHVSGVRFFSTFDFRHLETGPFLNFGLIVSFVPDIRLPECIVNDLLELDSRVDACIVTICILINFKIKSSLAPDVNNVVHPSIY